MKLVPGKTYSFNFPDEIKDLFDFDFDELLSLTTAIHESVHLEQDLYCGVGHIAYELQCIIDKCSTSNSSKKKEEFACFLSIYEFWFFSQSGKEILDIISRTVDINSDPDYEWSLIKDSSGLDVLETHAALLTYLDISRRLGQETHVQDFLYDIHIRNMQPTYRRLYDFIRKAIIGQQMDEYLRTHSNQENIKIIELNLHVLACLILELSIHLPPVDTFALDWCTSNKMKCLQFHPLFRVAAITGAFNIVMEQSGVETLNKILHGGDVNFYQIISKIENLYGWIPYNSVTESWLNHYDGCTDHIGIKKFRCEALARRFQNPNFISLMSRRLNFHQDQPIFIKTLEKPIVFTLNSYGYIFYRDVPKEHSQLWEALNEHLINQQNFHSRLPNNRR